MKLAVIYPWSSPFIWTQFVDSALNLEHPKDCEVRFFRGRGWSSARRHIDGCEQALLWNADLITIIGSDQTYPSNMLCRLIDRWNSGCEVVAALVPVRGYLHWQDMKPFQPMAWRLKTNSETGTTEYRNYRCMELDADMIHVVTRADGELVKAHFVGSGVIMFHRDHLKALKKPWFKETIIEESQIRIANMDCTFAWRLQLEAFAQLWIDTTIEVKHLHTFEIDDTFSERFADWAKPDKGDADICKFVKP